MISVFVRDRESEAYARERHRLMSASLPPTPPDPRARVWPPELSPSGYLFRDAGGVWRLADDHVPGAD